VSEDWDEVLALIKQAEDAVLKAAVLYRKLSDWINARVRCSVDKNHGVLLPPDTEEIRILAELDRVAASCRWAVEQLQAAAQAPWHAFSKETLSAIDDLVENAASIVPNISLDGS